MVDFKGVQFVQFVQNTIFGQFGQPLSSLSSLSSSPIRGADFGQLRRASLWTRWTAQ